MLLRLQNDCAIGGWQLARIRVFQSTMLNHAMSQYMICFAMFIVCFEESLEDTVVGIYVQGWDLVVVQVSTLSASDLPGGCKVGVVKAGWNC